jgi:MFS transporter, DHA1 family, tetracycline resistance protein
VQRSPAHPSTSPAHPSTSPAHPSTSPAHPSTSPAHPSTSPAHMQSGSGTDTGRLEPKDPKIRPPPRCMADEGLLAGLCEGPAVSSGAEGASDQSVRSKSLLAISFLYAFYNVVLTILIPALPVLVLDVTNDDSGQAAYLLGIANFIMYIVEFFVSPVVGSLADHVGRKPILVMSFFFCAMQFGLLFFFPSIAMILFTRILSGISDCCQAIYFTVATDIAIYNNEEVTHSYGLISAMLGLGMVIGSLLGGVLCESFNVHLCLLVATILSVIGGILTHVLLEESLSYVNRQNIVDMDYRLSIDLDSPVNETLNRLTFDTSRSRSISTTKDSKGIKCCTFASYWQDFNPIRPLILHFRNPAIRFLSYPYILASLVSGLGFIWYIYMDERYHASPTDVSVFFAVNGVVSMFVQGYLMKYIVPVYWDEQYATIYGYILQGVQCICNGFMPNLYGNYALVFIFAIGQIAEPALKALIVKSSFLYSDDAYAMQGNLQGALVGIRTLSTAMGALIFPAVYSLATTEGMSLVFIPFALGGSLFLLSALLLCCTTPMKGELPKGSISTVDDVRYASIDTNDQKDTEINTEVVNTIHTQLR